MVVKHDIMLRRLEPGEASIQTRQTLAKLALRAWKIPALAGFEQGALVDFTDDDYQKVEAGFLDIVTQADAQVLIAERDGKIAGWGAITANTNYISDLWVDPDFHRQGIGRILMDAMMAEMFLSGWTEVTIGTHAKNLPAIALYERCGFAIYWREIEYSKSFGRDVEKVRMRAGL